VAKIYAPGKATTERAHKLVVMLAHPPDAPQSADDHVPLAWPHRLLTRLGDANAVVGFLMPRAPAAAQAIDCYNPQRRLEICSLFDYRYLLRTARNLAAAARTVHAHGYVIGDLKHSNVLVSQTALVTLVDTDSFQVRCPQSGRIYPCRVETPDYTPPERQNDPNSAAPLTPEHDLFALGVLIFQLLMEGTHPFAGVYKGECDPPSFEECLAARHFPYGAKPGPYRPGRRAAPSFEILPPTLQALFLRCEDSYYSAPYAYVGKRLEVFLYEKSVQIYEGVTLLTTHPRATKKGQRLTRLEHYPPEKAIWLSQTPEHSREEAAQIGPFCLEVVEHLLCVRPVDNRQAAGKLVALAAKVGGVRLEAACARALRFGDPRYRRIKNILDAGLENEPDAPAVVVSAKEAVIAEAEPARFTHARSLTEIFWEGLSPC